MIIECGVVGGIRLAREAKILRKPAPVPLETAVFSSGIMFI
jgi:hypothetical protein